MSETKKIVVLGAGYGGVLTAKKLAKKFKKRDDVSITLIDKNPYHTMLTELHEVAAGRAPETAVRIELEKIFAGRKVELVMDHIGNIDFKQKKLEGKDKTYDYDYLVLGTGSKPTFFGCKGAEKNALTLWSFDDAVRIKHHIINSFIKASKETDVWKRRKLLSFIIIGSGFTGVEMAGELGEWVNRLSEDYGIDRAEVKIYNMDMLKKILPMLEDSLIDKTCNRLRKLGIEILTESNITEVKEDRVVINEEREIEANTIIWTAGIEGSEVIQNSDDVETVARGRVETDEYLRAKGKKDVFVVGDNIFFIPEGEEKPVPQMVENAEQSSDLVAENLTATINEKELEPYKPKFHGVMVSVGGRYAVAQVGNPNKPLKFSGWIAMFIKHFINVIYFIQIAGFHKPWNYIIDEFFHVPDKRSFLGGHFAKRSPNFWLVPLRIFVGWKWLEEGLAKVGDVIKDPSNIFLIPAKVTDAATAASGEAAETATEWGEALGVPGWIQSISDWGMNLMFYTPEGDFTVMATIFQTAMVFAEIIFGIFLIIGMFTAFSSLATFVMSLLIWASGTAPLEMAWYFVAEIALIGGSGSTFGVDYYLLPWLKKKWKNIKWVKKWYLYS
ncbi:NAD(P)/FAD-dependent oxidoreductase [Geotoga petraea]|jgi:NADH dehydrogenase|uniref:NADH:ubiquinone reductase (non-electrogenic) n=1 Tax=Geotoga petraea TaxID=28234 RepID=A0A4Z0VYS8_9BACT|nr:NAD(P)/FAD-dependent oxidoreductase [Geotoga petraea]TGG87953.1 NAD(P)/FAD-dependent oxidoreductase [Geotoga petraea]